MKTNEARCGRDAPHLKGWRCATVGLPLGSPGGAQPALLRSLTSQVAKTPWDARAESGPPLWCAYSAALAMAPPSADRRSPGRASDLAARTRACGRST